MPTITIEVPNSLAERLSSYQERLPEILALGLRELSPLPGQVYQYVLEFLAKDPSPEQLNAFRPTSEMQNRLQMLLEREKTGLLTDMERTELDEYERIEHIMIMLKSQAL
jgi:hypothetical protein